MRNILTVGLLLFATLSFSEEMEAVVRENCQTNVLYTWEGEFRVCEVGPLLTNDLYVCTFTNGNCEGTLVEIYAYHSNGLVRVFQSDRNVKGVTPVVLKMGVDTNSPSSLIWGLWRHPGNGGSMQYNVYEYTDLTMRTLVAFEYMETTGGHSWFLVDGDGELGVSTNLDFTTNRPLWTNRRTRYGNGIMGGGHGR